MSHLGERVAALVDGELDHGTRDRLFAHLTGCATCRAEVEAARQVKSRLATLPAPVPSPALLTRLVAMAEPGEPLPPSRPSFPGTPRPSPLPAPGRPPRAARRTTGPASRRIRRLARVQRPRRARVVAAGMVSLAVITLGTAFVAGAERGPSGPPLAPPSDRFTLEHAVTTGQVAVVDPAFGAVSASFGTAGVAAVPTLVGAGGR